jgi:transposase
VRNRSVWERACGLTETVVEGVDFDDGAEAIVVAVRPAARARSRCGRCCRRSPRYDLEEGRRRWRALDLGTTKVFLEAAAPRVRCRTHGVTVAAAPADMADWIAGVVARRAPQAQRSADPFHVVAWAIEALDIERRRAWNEAKGRRHSRGLRRHPRSTGDAQLIFGSRYALWKNPSDLTGRQRHQLDWIAKTDPRLRRAYLLKEGLRYVFAVKGAEGKTALDHWTSWARRSRLSRGTRSPNVLKVALHELALSLRRRHDRGPRHARRLDRRPCAKAITGPFRAGKAFTIRAADRTRACLDVGTCASSGRSGCGAHDRATVGRGSVALAEGRAGVRVAG